jgi:hypothetical protein
LAKKADIVAFGPDWLRRHDCGPVNRAAAWLAGRRYCTQVRRPRGRNDEQAAGSRQLQAAI